MLTKKQQVLLHYICERIDFDGVSPSFEEMKLYLGLKSKSGVHRLVKALEERGFIERLPNRARALKIVEIPDQLSVLTPKREKLTENRPNSLPGPNIVLGKFPQFTKDKDDEDEDEDDRFGTLIPLLGHIAAGTPIEALESADEHITLPNNLSAKSKNSYALEVSGDSMIGVGILDGDIVIIERCQTAENGSIVVALIQDHEATLKRLRQRGNSVALESANPAYATRIFGPEQVKIQGVLIGLIRKY